jgi:hypothetical protein
VLTAMAAPVRLAEAIADDDPVCEPEAEEELLKDEADRDTDDTEDAEDDEADAEDKREVEKEEQ